MDALLDEYLVDVDTPASARAPQWSFAFIMVLPANRLADLLSAVTRYGTDRANELMSNMPEPLVEDDRKTDEVAVRLYFMSGHTVRFSYQDAEDESVNRDFSVEPTLWDHLHRRYQRELVEP